MTETAAEVLAEVAREARACTKCRLCETRTQAVPGEGPPDAPVLFVGEGPGQQEDAQGRPFVGAAGTLLTKLLGSIKTPREKVFIANVVKCRPPGNRVPAPDEIAACLPYLVRQMGVLQPRIVCILGATALAALAGPKEKISRAHGRAVWDSGRWFFPTYHPAAALRSTDVGEVMQEDFRRLRRLIDVEWGTSGTWKSGIVAKLFEGDATTEPVEDGGSVRSGAISLVWTIEALHPTFRSTSTVAELVRRFVARKHKSVDRDRLDVTLTEITDGAGRAVTIESAECETVRAEAAIRD
ncbi:MAG: uracil-DNA glycosylase [Armatimonadetes bacterium]|nr:uracil-DNA glycosylase [Armatimonadota bacterium]